MHTVHLFNPVAGAGRRFADVRAAVEKTGEPIFVTENSGHAGTVSFTVVPAGSGNDFSACVNGSAHLAPGIHALDLVRVTDPAGNVRYFANSLNMGFDCDVVRETDTLKHKRGLSGSAAYIAGVLVVLARKKPAPLSLTLYGCRPFGAEADLAEPVTIEQSALLCACANGPFCGGGFKGAPLCDLSDGYMDVLAVKNISRARFLSMVGGYHDGTYISPDGVLKPSFAQILSYHQCRRAVLSSPAYYCLDGEVHAPAASITVEVVPHAVRYLRDLSRDLFLGR